MSDKIHYQNNFLTQVILRIDHVEQLGDTGNLVCAGVKTIFPITEKSQAMEGDFKLDVKSGEVQQTRRKFDVYTLYKNKNKEMKFEFTGSHALLEYKKYPGSEVLTKDIDSSLAVYIDTKKISMLKRVGLRYINKINLGKQTDWNAYINDSMTQASRLANEIGGSQIQMISSLETRSDDINTRLQYGLPNPNYPSALTLDDFIIDIDSYTIFPSDLEDDSLEKIYSRLHDRTLAIFEASIKDPLRKVMKKER